MEPYTREIRISVIALFCLIVIVCGIYPVSVWIAGQLLFPRKANGSLITSKGRAIGSELLGQKFSGERYFHPRPSAAGTGYDTLSSGGTNLGPISKRLIDTVRDRVAQYRLENDLSPSMPVPADAVTASSSGLDPHISVQNALIQAKRVAKSRGIPVDAVKKKIEMHTEGRTFGIMGQPQVNVLMLNLDLDGRQ